MKEAARAFKDKGEVFEQVLGRCMRREGLGYDDYVRLIGIVRGRAKKDDVSLDKAAKLLARSSEV
ncbi:MAG: hypothetical protein HPY73_04945 [Methanomassiliicoccales archaeon]|nr:MAG: hypothetical protein HPY73_04945 [Methanomassiliicoccales archaeon]